MEDSSGIPQNLEDMCIFRADPANPGYESTIDVESLHREMLLNTDGKSMQWADWLLVLREIFIEIFSASQGLFGKEFGDTVCLKLSAYIRHLSLKRGHGEHTSFCASPARRRKAFVTATALSLPFAS